MQYHYSSFYLRILFVFVQVSLLYNYHSLFQRVLSMCTKGLRLGCNEYVDDCNFRGHVTNRNRPNRKWIIQVNVRRNIFFNAGVRNPSFYTTFYSVFGALHAFIILKHEQCPPLADTCKMLCPHYPQHKYVLCSIKTRMRPSAHCEVVFNFCTQNCQVYQTGHTICFCVIAQRYTAQRTLT